MLDDDAARDGGPGGGEQFLGLIFVNLHGGDYRRVRVLEIGVGLAPRGAEKLFANVDGRSRGKAAATAERIEGNGAALVKDNVQAGNAGFTLTRLRDDGHIVGAERPAREVVVELERPSAESANLEIGDRNLVARGRRPRDWRTDGNIGHRRHARGATAHRRAVAAGKLGISGTAIRASGLAGAIGRMPFMFMLTGAGGGLLKAICGCGCWAGRLRNAK